MVITGADHNLYSGIFLSFVPADLTCVATVKLTQTCCIHQQLHKVHIMMQSTQVQINITFATNRTVWIQIMMNLQFLHNLQLRFNVR